MESGELIDEGRVLKLETDEPSSETVDTERSDNGVPGMVGRCNNGGAQRTCR